MAIPERRFRTGFVAELDVVRVHTELANIESDALLLERGRGEFEHALAVIIGEVASTFELEQQEWAGVVPGHFLPLGLIARACRRAFSREFLGTLTLCAVAGAQCLTC